MTDLKERIKALTPEQRKKLQLALSDRGVDLVKNISKSNYDPKTNIPITPAQSRLWFLSQIDSTAYSMPIALRVRGSLRIDSLEFAIQQLFTRHDALRTIFLLDQNLPIQRVNDAVNFSLERVDLSEFDKSIIDQKLFENIQAVLQRPFELDKGPLLRASLFVTGHQESIVLLSVHHIVGDDWSLQIMLRELINFYQAHSMGIKLPIEPLAVQFPDYCFYLKEKYQNDKFQESLEYWVSKLGGAAPHLALPGFDGSSAELIPKGRILKKAISSEKVDLLENLAKQNGTTVFVVLLSCFNIMLRNYTGQSDLVIGTSVANRDMVELEPMIGLLVDTLVLRNVIDRHATIAEVIKSTHKILLEAKNNDAVPFDQIVQNLGIERNPNHHPVFQIMFELESGSFNAIESNELQIEALEIEQTIAKFDLSVEHRRNTDGMEISFEYRTDCYNGEVIKGILEHYVNFLESASVHALSHNDEPFYMSSGERERLLKCWAEGPRYEQNILLAHQLVEAQFERTPKATAIRCSNRSFTYEEVEHRANRLANALVDKYSVEEEECVGVYLDRDEHYLVAILAIMKAGAAFVPLSIDAPPDRTREMLIQSKSRFVLVNSTKANEVITTLDIATPVAYEESFPEIGNSLERPQTRGKPGSLAYVIFTSGSTGKPKGVMIEHRGMVNHLLAKIVDLNISDTDSVAEMAVTTFDVSIWQYMAALCVGGVTVVVEGLSAWDPSSLFDEIKDGNITIVESVPSHTKVLLQEIHASNRSQDLQSLRWYISNGELLPVEQVQDWYEALPNIPLINTYGATEASDDTSHFHISSSNADSNSFIPISGSLINLNTYLLDESLHPVPIGATGEIYLGGAGVGRGYILDPLRTARQFIPDPFSVEPGSRLYKTGDLARYHIDGELEFMGRVDHQIKIRGYRVETGEIESILKEHEKVDICVVVTQSDNQHDRYLVAHVVPNIHPGPSTEELKQFCAEKLNDYMVPSLFNLLDELPLTESGKLDRKKLPRVSRRDKAQYVPPVSELEKEMTSIWEDALQTTHIGMEDDFFQLGGHSLLAAQMVISIRQSLNKDIPMRLLFENPSIGNFTRAIEGLSLINQSNILLEKPPLGDNLTEFKLAPAQIPEWFAHQLDSSSPVYNISMADLFFTNLDIENFIRAWQIVIDRQDVFRTRIHSVDGVAVQYLGDPVMLDIKDIVIDCTDLDQVKQEKMAGHYAEEFSKAEFDFENAPLFRLKIVRYKNAVYQLLFVIHHVIWDETSSMNLLRDIGLCYNILSSGQQPVLNKLPFRYLDYVRWINNAIDDGQLENDRRYWLKELDNAPPPLDLPTDYTRPAIQSFEGDAIDFWIPRHLLLPIREFCEENKVTKFMFFLAVLETYFARITGSQDFVIGCPIAGRDFPEFQDIYGLFAVPMPIRCKIDDETSFSNLMLDVKEKALLAFEHYRYPCNLIIEELNTAKDLSRPKLFSIMYGLQNDKTNLLRSAGLTGVDISRRELYSAEAHGARFDLTFAVEEKDDEVLINCIYASELFHRGTILSWLEGITVLIEDIIAEPKANIYQLDILSEQDKKVYLPVPKEPVFKGISAVNQLFESQTQLSPNNVALCGSGCEQTYRSLNEQANQLVHQLLEMGVGPQSRIGLFFGYDRDTVRCVLACLKVGACFVPLSVNNPVLRNSEICNSASVDIIISNDYWLSDDDYSNYFGDLTNTPILNLTQLESGILEHDTVDFLQPADRSDLAYIAFTSGSTGKPKGIPITHAGVLNLIAATQRTHTITSTDSIAMLTNFGFDPIVLEIFWPLAFGAQIAVVDKCELLSPPAILNLIENSNVSILQGAPSLFLDLLSESKALGLTNLARVRLIIVGGAKLTRFLQEDLVATFDCEIANHYGPTEVTVDATCFKCDHPFIGDNVPIGRPLLNNSAFVWDRHKNPVPISVPGELWISSPGLTEGYIIDGAIRPDGFQSLEGIAHQERIFNTGDLAKYDANGNLIFLGRADSQIKVSGARIELEEIQNHLLAHPAIKDAVVLFQESNEEPNGPILRSYVVLKDSDFTINHQLGKLQIFTLEQRPDLVSKFSRIHAQIWPDYFAGDATFGHYWSQLQLCYPEFQFGLLDDQENIVALGHSAPSTWDLDSDSLPDGWSAALAKVIECHGSADGLDRNCLVGFVAITLPQYQSYGLSVEILNGFKNIAAANKLERVIIPVRPTKKAQMPQMDIDDYMRLRKDDDQLFDPWLRVHERAGGKVIKAENSSQLITGSIADWETWTGASIVKTGEAIVVGTLAPVEFDLEQDLGIYNEPCVWVLHELNEKDKQVEAACSQNDIRLFLLGRVPAYMVPHKTSIISNFPLTERGKVDLTQLSESLDQASAVVAPSNPLQIHLCEIWQAILSRKVDDVSADFFSYGGQSLHVVKVLARIHSELGVKITIRDFYKYSTIIGLESLLVNGGLD